jgi:SAM-dependent methyltransferase
VLDIQPTETVADLGCGTGKLTRLLNATGARVVGIEPLGAMVATFRRQCPDVPLVAGVAESIPLRSESLDAVVCASAFHWFDHDRAIPELHRVLRRGGRLCIVWNRRDDLSGWPAELFAITEAHRGDTPGYRSGAWRYALERSRLFGQISEHWFDHVQRADVDGLLARIGSISFIETLPTEEREGVMARARAFLETHPDTRDQAVLELPYRTVVYITQRH